MRALSSAQTRSWWTKYSNGNKKRLSSTRMMAFLTAGTVMTLSRRLLSSVTYGSASVLPMLGFS